MNGDAEHPIDAWALLPPAEVVVSVDLAPVPQIPFASLRGSLIPVRDADGELVDWEIAASSLAEPETVATYWEWRRRWKQQWPIGPISNLGALERVIEAMSFDTGPELGELLRRLVAAQGHDVRWTPDDDDAVVDRVDLLRIALIDTIEAGPGSGIVDHTPGTSRQHGLARSWVVDDVEVVLAATSTTSVVVRPGDGLVVQRTSSSSAGAFDAAESDAFTWVVDVDLLADPVVITNDEGQRLELSQEAARPLGWLVPRSLQWHVVTVPLVAVWSSLLIGLPDAVRAARLLQSPLHFTTVAPVR
jgi:hypothetical protein